MWSFQLIHLLIVEAGIMISVMDDGKIPVQNFPGRVQAHVSRFARLELAGSSVHA